MAQSKQSQYPNLNPSAMANSAQNAAQNAMSSISNSHTVQTLQNGPVAEKARAEANATKSEFSNLASSRTTPQSKTATGQPLTHYHSFFYNLLSWENPRATAISYATAVVLIFIARYVPLVSYSLRLLWITLGIVAATETVAQLALGQSVAARVRPRSYFTLPREKLEASLEDVEQLINFFVIEIQRILFAENVYATIAAFFTTLITYFMIKFTPAWGLAVVFTTAVYFLPLVYIQNKDLIDGQISHASKIASDQSSQIRSLAQQHTQSAVSASQSALKDASTKAQEMVGQAKQAAVDNGIVSHETAGLSTTQKVADKVTPTSTRGLDGSVDRVDTSIPTPGITKSETEEVLGVKKEDFPVAPNDQPFSDYSEVSKVQAEGGPIASQ